MWAFGGGLIDADDLEIHVADQGTLDAFAFVQSLRDSGAMDPAFDPANQYGNNMTAFKEGKAGIIFNGPWASSDILSGAAFADPANLGVAPIPAGPAGQGSPVGGHGYTIYAGSPYPEEALNLIRCLNTPENTVRMANELNVIPALRATYDSPDLLPNPILDGFLAQMEVATNRPVIPAGGGIYTDFDPAFAAVMLGEKTPEEAMAEVVTAWEALLALTEQ
jgi:arabinogalactan oligomer/maltooligosaccharide transport system substrate-binding protein